MSLKEEVEKLEQRVAELEKENEELKKQKSDRQWIEPIMSDRTLTTALCAVNIEQLPKDYQRAEFNIKMFEKVFKQLKVFETDSFVLYVKKDYPAILTTKDTNTGLVIAPRISE